MNSSDDASVNAQIDARHNPVSIPDSLDSLTEYWSQLVIGRANDTLLKVAKGIGSTRWHSHDDQDETFLVFTGSMTVQLRDRDVVLSPGDLFVVPRGVEHCPTADSETRFLILGTTVTSNAAGGKPDWSYSSNAPDNRHE